MATKPQFLVTKEKMLVALVTFISRNFQLCATVLVTNLFTFNNNVMHFTTLVQTCLATNEVVVKLHLFVVCFIIPLVQHQKMPSKG